jgi:hypothetical protein
MARTPPRTRKQLRAGDTFVVPLPDGRLGACRVLRAETDEHSGKHDALVASLAWRGAAPPPLTEPRLRLLQRLTVHDMPGKPNLFWVREERLPASLTYLGVLPPSADEAVLGTGVGYSDWESFVTWIATQWQHEDEQGLPPADSEAELRRRARAASRRHAARRRREALENLSGDPFPPDEEYGDEENAEDYRQILRETLAALLELGPDGDEVAKLDLLRECAERFNDFELDIDTYLREVICDRFDDLVWVAGLEDYGDDLEDCPWRDF